MKLTPLKIKGLQGTFYDARELLAESLKNPEFRKEYEALDEEFQLIHDDLKKRIEKSSARKKLNKRSITTRRKRS